GGGPLTVSGGGTLVLDNINNTYFGAITVTGTLQGGAGNNAAGTALRMSPITLNGGLLTAAGTNLNLHTGEISGPGTVNLSTGTLTPTALSAAAAAAAITAGGLDVRGTAVQTLTGNVTAITGTAA